MSIYTEYKIDARENLSRIRNPYDSASDGICEQRVIFSNQNNIYYGIFAGRISSDGQTFNNCTINQGTLHGATLDDVTIKSGDRIIPISELADNVDEISANVKTNSDNIYSLSSSISGLIDISAVEHMKEDLLCAIQSSDVELCGMISCANENIEQNAQDILRLANISENLSDMLEKHILSNEIDFQNIISAIQNDKHYSIVGQNGEIISSYPYNVSDFAVNVIQDHSQDLFFTAMSKDGQIIDVGTGFYLATDEIFVNMFNLQNTDLFGVLEEYAFSLQLEKNQPQTIPNDCKVIWNGDTITFTRQGRQIIDVIYAKDDGDSLNVATIHPFEKDESGRLTSCQMNLQWIAGVDKYATFFNPFIQKFGWALEFTKDEPRIVSGDMLIEMVSRSNTFKFGRNLDVIPCYNISSASNPSIVFGAVLSGEENVISDESGKISAINVANIDLPYSTYLNVQLSANEYAWLNNDLFMAFSQNDENNVSFNVISSVEYYSYDLIGDGDAIYGHIIPELRHYDIVTKKFTQLSLHLDAGPLSDLWNVDYVLTGEENGKVWRYYENTISNNLSITFSIDMLNNMTLALSGQLSTIGDITYSSQYVVRHEKHLVESMHASCDIVSSNYDPIQYDSLIYDGDIRSVNCGSEHDVDWRHLQCNQKDDCCGKLRVNVPKRSDEMQYAREFIVAAKISSMLSDVQFQIVDPNSSHPEDYILDATCNGLSDIYVPTNKWVSLKIQEVRNNVFVVDDIGNNQITSSISVLSDDMIDVQNNISDIWKNMRGGLNFMGVLSATADSDSLSTFLCANFLSIYNLAPSAAANVKVRQGFFYPINAENHLSHYNIEGLKITHGDWLIAKNNFIVSAATSNDMTVFDAQDTDNVRLNDNNRFTGNNTFTLSTKFEDYIEVNCISTESLSIDSDKLIYDGISSLKDLSNDAYSKIKQNADDIQSISTIVDTKTYLGSVDTPATSITLSDWFDSCYGINRDTLLHKGAFARSSKNYEIIYGAGSYFVGENDYLIVNKASVVVSSLEWSDINIIQDPKNEATTISNDLSILRGRVDGTELSIDSLSNDVSVLAFQCMHYRGDLSGTDLTLSDLLHHKYKDDSTIQAGEMLRFNGISTIVPDAYGEDVKLYKNDYIIFKHNVPYISKVALSDFNIIRDAEAEGIALSVQMVANDAVLSNAIDNKVYIDALSVESISAQHISQSDFYQDVVTSSILSNMLYVVSSDYINAYGEQLKNLAYPTDLSDATTKDYVDVADEMLSGRLSALVSAMYDDLEHVATDSIISSLNQKSAISNVICAIVGIRDTLVELRQTLSTALWL